MTKSLEASFKIRKIESRCGNLIIRVRAVIRQQHMGFISDLPSKNKPTSMFFSFYDHMNQEPVRLILLRENGVGSWWNILNKVKKILKNFRNFLKF